MECGGYIQRIQHGEPDDQKDYSTYVYPFFIDTEQQELEFRNWSNNYYPNGYLHTAVSPLTGITNSGAHAPLLKSPTFPYNPRQTYTVDREQDIFVFSFNGRKVIS